MYIVYELGNITRQNSYLVQTFIVGCIEIAATFKELVLKSLEI